MMDNLIIFLKQPFLSHKNINFKEDNYFNHFWYDIWNEDESYFRGYPKGWIYSWYKGNVFEEDMELKKLRPDHKICLFNNSASDNYDANEIKELW